MSSIITLTTDFGIGSPYVAAMKGVILSINPAATVVDVTHAIPPQDVRSAAIVLSDTTKYFPPDAIHVAVVDPGVGTSRPLIYAQIGTAQYLAPDNGLLSFLTQQTKSARIVRLERPEHWLPEVSATFHGRDILAPVAARLSLGLAPDQLGTPQQKLIELDWSQPRVEPRRMTGLVWAVDSFGNLSTNITADLLAQVPGGGRTAVRCTGHAAQGLVHTYGERPDGELIALVGSSGRLELAVVGGSAAARLGARSGAAVEIVW